MFRTKRIVTIVVGACALFSAACQLGARSTRVESRAATVDGKSLALPRGFAAVVSSASPGASTAAVAPKKARGAVAPAGVDASPPFAYYACVGRDANATSWCIDDGSGSATDNALHTYSIPGTSFSLQNYSEDAEAPEAWGLPIDRTATPTITLGSSQFTAANGTVADCGAGNPCRLFALVYSWNLGVPYLTAVHGDPNAYPGTMATGWLDAGSPTRPSTGLLFPGWPNGNLTLTDPATLFGPVGLSAALPIYANDDTRALTGLPMGTANWYYYSVNRQSSTLFYFWLNHPDGTPMAIGEPFDVSTLNQVAAFGGTHWSDKFTFFADTANASYLAGNGNGDYAAGLVAAALQVDASQLPDPPPTPTTVPVTPTALPTATVVPATPTATATGVPATPTATTTVVPPTPTATATATTVPATTPTVAPTATVSATAVIQAYASTSPSWGFGCQNVGGAAGTVYYTMSNAAVDQSAWATWSSMTLNPGASFGATCSNGDTVYCSDAAGNVSTAACNAPPAGLPTAVATPVPTS